MPESSEYFIEGLVSLYYLLIHADGRIDDKELAAGRLMCDYEGIDEMSLGKKFEDLNSKSAEDILRGGIKALKMCEKGERLRCLAWITMITNSDGYMDSEEWKLLYRVYHKSLRLKLEDILKVQDTLPKAGHN